MKPMVRTLGLSGKTKKKHAEYPIWLMEKIIQVCKPILKFPGNPQPLGVSGKRILNTRESYVCY